ncbi:hypothetical protein [Leptolyngbya sp. Cla-17]|nr:hypothetical protein [Leptolyngbya sp. Cla-17]
MSKRLQPNEIEHLLDRLYQVKRLKKSYVRHDTSQLRLEKPSG